MIRYKLTSNVVSLVNMHILILITALVTIVGCSNNSKTKQVPEGLNLSSDSSSSLSSTGVETGELPEAFDTSFCGDFVVLPSSVESNVYSFRAPGNDCFGVVDNGAQKKEVPLSVRTGSSENEISIGGSLKIYNSHPDISSSRYSLITFEVTNTASVPVCFINTSLSGISLYNIDGEEIDIFLGRHFLDGELFSLGVNLASTNTCLSPGKSLRYFNQFDGMSTAVVKAAASALIDALDGSPGDKNRVAHDSLSVIEMSVNHPGVSISFVNNTANDISLSTYQKIAYYDGNGYAVSYDFLNLVGRDVNQGVVESGGSFTLESTGSLSPIYSQVTAKEAVVHMEWEYSEEL